MTDEQGKAIEESNKKPYGVIDPNSQHQMWSRWSFLVQPNGVIEPLVKEVSYNAGKYFIKLFGSSVGRCRCEVARGIRLPTRYRVIIEIEGPPAHDSEFQARVKADFTQRFMRPGFGVDAQLVDYEVAILAGDRQEGKPPDQMLVMPKAILMTDVLPR